MSRAQTRAAGLHLAWPKAAGVHANPAPAHLPCAGPFTIDLSRCSFCDSRADGTPLGGLLYCVVCRPGTTPIGDRYRQVRHAVSGRAAVSVMSRCSQALRQSAGRGNKGIKFMFSVSQSCATANTPTDTCAPACRSA